MRQNFVSVKICKIQFLRLYVSSPSSLNCFVLFSSIPCVSGIWTNFTLLWWLGFRLEPISGNDQAPTRTVAHVKSGQESGTKNNNLATLQKLSQNR